MIYKFSLDGGFTAFGAWSYVSGSTCSATCGNDGVQLQVQSRTCTNPVPQNNGSPCVGPVESLRNSTCQVQPPACGGKIGLSYKYVSF